jgi:excisionase family DNA binding protein
MSKQRDTFTTAQAARLLGVSVATVVNWIDDGRLRAHKTPGGHRRISREDLVSFAHHYEMPLDGVEVRGAGDSKRILVVDDDPAILTLYSDALEIEGGFEVRTARSGFAAGLAVARWRPDLLLLDVHMPGMDGFEVLERMEAADALGSIPVVLCTAYSEKLEQHPDVREKVAAVLTKPVSIDRLLDTVKQALS